MLLVLQGLAPTDKRQLLLSVPWKKMITILQTMPGQACVEALLSIGAPLNKDALLSMPASASGKILHAASFSDLALLIKVLHRHGAAQCLPAKFTFVAAYVYC